MYRRAFLFACCLLPLCCPAQKWRTSAYYAEVKGAFYTNRLVFVPMADGRYLLEYYFYGGGEFKGEPHRDTFVQKGSILKSRDLTASFVGKKLLFTSKTEGKKQFNFREMQPCDSLINITRNWTYRETLKRSFADADDAKSFGASTDHILSNYCYEDFRERAEELKKEIESQ
jgi:hypothetical protein